MECLLKEVLLYLVYHHLDRNKTKVDHTIILQDIKEL